MWLTMAINNNFLLHFLWLVCFLLVFSFRSSFSDSIKLSDFYLFMLLTQHEHCTHNIFNVHETISEKRGFERFCRISEDLLADFLLSLGSLKYRQKLFHISILVWLHTDFKSFRFPRNSQRWVVTVIFKLLDFVVKSRKLLRLWMRWVINEGSAS